MSDTSSARRHDRLASLLSGTIAGFVAGGAYLVVAGIDNRISGQRLYDLQLLARPFVRSRRRANALGAAIHAGNSAALGALYGVAIEPHIPGPGAVKGIIFVLIEGTVLYPILALERRHPAVREDEIGPYWTWKSFLWNWPRHFAYGMTLGWLYQKLRHK
jgi:hypothetical protein